MAALAHPAELERLSRRSSHLDPQAEPPFPFLDTAWARALDAVRARNGGRVDGVLREVARAWMTTAEQHRARAMREAPWPVVLAAWQRIATMPASVRATLITDYGVAREWLDGLRAQIAIGALPLDTLVEDVLAVRFHRQWWAGAAAALSSNTYRWFVPGDPIFPLMETLLRAPDPARPKRLQQEQQFVRQRFATALATVEHTRGRAQQSADAATDLLDRTVRAVTSGPEALVVLWSPEEVATLPWLQGLKGRDRAPTPAEVEEAVCRVTIPAYRRQVRGSRIYPFAVLIEALLALPSSVAIGGTLWARAATSSQRLSLMLYGRMLEGGPWWRDAAWRTEAIATLADPAVKTDLESVSDRCFPLLRTSVGEGSADQWLRAVLRCYPAVLRPGISTRHRGWLNQCLTHPTWRVSPEGLLPLLQCKNPEIRIAAQQALALRGATAAPTAKRTSTVVPRTR